MARKYLYKGLHGGRRTAGHVEADSVGLARSALTDQGLSDVVIFDDDFLSDLARHSRDTVKGWDAELELISRDSPTAFSTTGYVLRKNAITYLTGVVLLAVSLYAGWNGWISGFIAATLAGLFGIALYPAWIHRLNERVHRLTWKADWPGVEQAARRVKALGVARAPTVQFDLDGRIAGAWVMMGRFDDAFALMQPWRDSTLIPKGAWAGRVGLLCFLARDWPRVLEYTERMLAESNGDQAKIDTALYLARLVGDDAANARAESLLASLDPNGAVPLQLGFIAWARGQVALNRRDDVQALQELVESVDQMNKFATQPAIWGALALATAALAVALTRNGRKDAAREMFASVRPIVERHGEDRLLAALREEGLLAAAGTP